MLVVETGANDGLRGLDPDSTRTNLEAIVRRARAADPAIPIILAGMEAPPNLGAAYTARFRALYRDLARRERLALIPFILQGVGGVDSLNQGDGIHPNAAGARIVAANVWKVLEPELAAAGRGRGRKGAQMYRRTGAPAPVSRHRAPGFRLTAQRTSPMAKFKPTPMPYVVERLDDGRDVRIQWEAQGHVGALSGALPPAGVRLRACVEEMSGAALLDPATVREDIRILGVRLVGQYALYFAFNDGHSTGIYPYEAPAGALPVRRLRREAGGGWRVGRTRNGAPNDAKHPGQTPCSTLAPPSSAASVVRCLSCATLVGVRPLGPCMPSGSWLLVHGPSPSPPPAVFPGR